MYGVVLSTKAAPAVSGLPVHSGGLLLMMKFGEWLCTLCLGAGLLEQAEDHSAYHAAHGQRHAVEQSMIDHGEDEDAAVRCPQGAAKGHGEGTGQGRANDTAGQHAERVGRRVGDGALGDKAEAHDIVDDAVAALIRVHFLGQNVVERAMAMGGTMPPTMTAAMTS